MLLENLNYTLVIMIKLTTILYLINKNHIINNLIILEFTVMTICLYLLINMMNLNAELYIMFFFLILMITESITGLSILILMVRIHSNDYLKSSTVVAL